MNRLFVKDKIELIKPILTRLSNQYGLKLREKPSNSIGSESYYFMLSRLDDSFTIRISYHPGDYIDLDIIRDKDLLKLLPAVKDWINNPDSIPASD